MRFDTTAFLVQTIRWGTFYGFRQIPRIVRGLNSNFPFLLHVHVDLSRLYTRIQYTLK